MMSWRTTNPSQDYCFFYGTSRDTVPRFAVYVGDLETVLILLFCNLLETILRCNFRMHEL